MPDSKPKVDIKAKTPLLRISDHAENKRSQAEELLNEIDNLALLLQEVKKQTDKIEAAADAIGDSILARLGSDGIGRSLSRGRPPIHMPAKSSARLRSLSPRAMLVQDGQS